MGLLKLSPLYPITLPDNILGLSHREQVKSYLEAGITLFQIRDKELEDRSYLKQLLECVSMAREKEAQLLVNDRCDLAVAARASGVHLGQEDISPTIARRLLGPDAILGISTHNRLQFEEAQELPVDYVAVGPVFSTQTKEVGFPPLGAGFFQQIAPVKKHPIVAIGGITPSRAARLWEAGVDSVAVISDLFSTGNLISRLREYLELSP